MWPPVQYGPRFGPTSIVPVALTSRSTCQARNGILVISFASHSYARDISVISFASHLYARVLIPVGAHVYMQASALAYGHCAIWPPVQYGHLCNMATVQYGHLGNMATSSLKCYVVRACLIITPRHTFEHTFERMSAHTCACLYTCLTIFFRQKNM